MSVSKPSGSYQPLRERARTVPVAAPTTTKWHDGLRAVRPARDLVLVEAEPYFRSSTVIIPESAARPGLYQGRVIAIGPKAALGAHCKVGDDVVFFRYEAVEMDRGARRGYFFVPEVELIGRLTEIDSEPKLEFHTRT